MSPSSAAFPVADAMLPELSVRAIAALVLYFERSYGTARLEQLWRESEEPVPLTYLHSHTNFVSVQYTEHLTNLLIRSSGDPEFLRKAMRMTATPEALGFAYYALKALGTPRLCYLKTVELNEVYNRVGRYSIESLGDDSMVLAYTSRVPFSTPDFCVGRMEQFASFPTIWGLPPAVVTESQCQSRGADSCRYHLHWQNPQRRWRRWAGAAAGMAGSWAFATTGHTALPTLLVGAGAAAGFGFGAWRDERKEVVRSSELLSSQTEGLWRLVEDLQRRSNEVFQANQLLEERVAQRTQELAETAAKLTEALAQQRELDRLKTQFFDNVSHELRTPLTLIFLSLESLLQKPEVPPEIRQYLETMDRSASKLLRLIDQLLDLAKIEAGKTRLRYQPVELVGFLKTSLLPFRVLADEKKVALELEGAAVAPVHVDPERLDGVFQNLLSNALKFTTRGSVVVRVSESPTHVILEVTDTGCGMAPEDLPRIFDRFAQADSAGIRRLRGTGIGLALVKETVELHAGKIEVSSSLDVGTTFRVSLVKGTAHIREDLRERRITELPVRRDRRRGADLIRSAKPLPPMTTRPELPADGDGERAPISEAGRRTLLVVEDDDEIRRFVCTFLSDDYRVLEATNGEEGLITARSEHPELVISDVMMPVMSGVQMTQALRSRPETADLPVILLTARNEVDATLTGLGSGANDYIGKPFSPRELVARVETQLRLRDAAAKVAENQRLATLGLLTTGFAHEVRNPLNGLINCLGPLKESLGADGDPEMTRGLISVLEECGQRIHYLAESLLTFSRPTDRKETVDIRAALENTLKVMGWKLPAGIKIAREFESEERVLGEAGALNQVWLNLIDNAVRAMNGKGTLTLGTRSDGELLVVSITDTGEGISPRNLAHLFQPFFSTRPAGEGTGLGLTLSRRIILRHGGRLEVKSEEGQGTTFSVILPLRRGVTAEASTRPALVSGLPN